MFSMGIGEAGLRNPVAVANGFNTSSIDLEFAGGLMLYDVFALTGALGIMAPGDATMSTAVTGQGQVTVFRYSIAATARTPFRALGSTRKGWVGGAVFAGVGWAGVSGTRSMPDCDDCDGHPFSMTGGMFWRVGADLAIPTLDPRAKWGFTLAYQQYSRDASLEDELLFSIAAWYP